MYPFLRNLVLLALLIGETLVAGYVALMVFLCSSWPADDAWAARANDHDWFRRSMENFVECAGITLIPAAIILTLNHFTMPALGFQNRRKVAHTVTALVALALLLLALVQSVNLYHDRPNI